MLLLSNTWKMLNKLHTAVDLKEHILCNITDWFKNPVAADFDLKLQDIQDPNYHYDCLQNLGGLSRPIGLQHRKNS